MLVQALSNAHRVGLGVVAACFIGFALLSAFVFPRIRASFPGRGLPAFIVVCVLFFLGMMSAVETFGAEPKEEGTKTEAESTSESTTTETTTTVATTTVQLPAATTTTAPKPKPPPAAAPQTIRVTETEFKITLATQPQRPGPVTFDVKNAGAIGHDFVVTGAGGTKGTPLLNSGQSAKLVVALKPGTYDLFCSVPGHKEAGMDVKLTVGS